MSTTNRIKELRKQMADLKSREAAINAANKGFKRLSKSAKRVAIAKDVIAQIKVKKYNATSGTYIQGLEPSELDGGDTQLCELLADNMPSCEVCARGAMFLSQVRKGNDITLRDISADYGNIHADEFENFESEIWDRKQVDLIECAYELTDEFNSCDIDESKIEVAMKFGRKYRSNEKRLIAIMENIIRNKGEFVP